MNSAESCLHDLFRAQAARTPDTPAIVSGHGQISYLQLVSVESNWHKATLARIWSAVLVHTKGLVDGYVQVAVVAASSGAECTPRRNCFSSRPTSAVQPGGAK